ncbi:MAG: hypothetical protein R6V35_05445 [Candidatus Nanohaloarchaea archaeon]
MESVLTFGLGLVLAIGVISAFETYSSGIYDASEEVQASIIQNRVLETFNVLQALEGSAEVELDLPESAGNRDYRVEASDNVAVITDSNEYERELSIDGSVTGSGSGEIRIVKSGNSYEISDR